MDMIIAANWKANPIGDGNVTSLEKSIQLLDNYAEQGLAGLKDRQVIIYASDILIPGVSAYIKEKGYNFKIGAQNVSSYYSGGPYTGQIPVPMFKDFGITEFLIGHSERRDGYERRVKETFDKVLESLEKRRSFSEKNKNELFLDVLARTSELFNSKILAVLKEKDATVTYCVGETEDEKKRGVTYEVLENQLEVGLKDVSKKDYGRIIIAYEPRWAIGGDKEPPTDEEIYTAHSKIEDMVGKSVPILYGGSVNPENIAKIISIDKVNGVLVGGASLNPKMFAQIVKYTPKNP